MSDDVALPLEFTEAAANKVKHLIAVPLILPAG
jgi:hypothetical protein